MRFKNPFDKDNEKNTKKSSEAVEAEARPGGETSDGKVVILLVDAENSQVAPEETLSIIKNSVGRPWVSRAYSKWSANPKLKNPFTKYREAGFECITSDSGSNNADIKLSVDAMELIFEYKMQGLSGSLIIAADGDRGFSHVFDRVKKQGWETILFAKKDSNMANKILYSAVDKVIYTKEPLQDTPDIKPIPQKEIKVSVEPIEGKLIDINKDVIQQDENNPIKGFTTSASPSLRFPVNPSDTAIILKQLNKLRNSNQVWDDDLSEKIKDKYGIAKIRINGVIIKITKMLNTPIKNEVIDWNKIPGTLDLANQLENYLISQIKILSYLDESIQTEINKYFIKVKNYLKEIEITVSKEKEIDTNQFQSITGFNTVYHPGKPSFTFPRNPKDTARILLMVHINRDIDMSWGELKNQMFQLQGVGKNRISGVIRNLLKTLNLEDNDSESVNWSNIPGLEILIDELHNFVVRSIPNFSTLDSNDETFIHQYFEKLKVEIIRIHMDSERMSKLKTIQKS